MKIDELNQLVENEALLNAKLIFFEKKGIIKKQLIDRDGIEGHIRKAEHNLNFIFDNLKLGYNDWCITGCYYAVYQISLALILARGYSSKNHDATLCLLIKEYLKEGVDKEDISLINSLFFSYNDLLFYIQAKNKREEANYSTKYLFDKENVGRLRIKTIDFVNKAKEILNSILTKLLNSLS